MNPELTISNLEKSYLVNGQLIPALQEISFKARAGEFISIVGPSGSGKSTLLNCIAGFVQPTSGLINLNDSSKKRIGVVFQNRELFPWLTVRENVAFGLRLQKNPRVEKITSGMLAKVGLKEFGEHYPHQLSIGMQQRVGIARALSLNPKILLLDEPFSSVDYITRITLQKLIVSLWESLKPTILLVTHDIDEAIFVGERLLVLSKSPGTIKNEFRISLPRPRNQALITTPEFVELKKNILLSFEEELNQ